MLSYPEKAPQLIAVAISGEPKLRARCVGGVRHRLPLPCGKMWLPGLGHYRLRSLQRYVHQSVHETGAAVVDLQHASRVVRPGRSFLRRMIDLAKIPKRSHHFVRLNMDV